MPKLMMPFLRISFMLLLFCSCKSYKVDGVAMTNKSGNTIVNPYFADLQTDYVYKANIEVYGNKLGGIFVVKKMNDTLHRIVFTSDFGSKFMDFELSEASFNVNYILDDLDKKMLINTLKEDFRILLQSNNKVVESFENEDYTVSKVRSGKYHNYYFKNKKTNSLEKIINTKSRKERIILMFDSNNSIFAENILILHKNIQLQISLNQLKN